MNSIDDINYLSSEEYLVAKAHLEKVTVLVLHWSATLSQQEIKEEIIWNFIARGDRMS